MPVDDFKVSHNPAGIIKKKRSAITWSSLTVGAKFFGKKIDNYRIKKKGATS
jgi:hypothetical protein